MNSPFAREGRWTWRPHPATDSGWVEFFTDQTEMMETVVQKLEHGERFNIGQVVRRCGELRIEWHPQVYRAVHIAEKVEP